MESPYMLLQIGLVVALCVALRVWTWTTQGTKGLPLPPGPRRLPLLGNLLDLPMDGRPEWETWIKHRELYGPISSVSIAGKTLVVLHDRDVASELLEKRGTKNSSRPGLEFAFNLVGLGVMTSSRADDATLRAHRRLMLQNVGTKAAVDRTEGIQRQEVGLTLVQMLENPQGLVDHLRVQAGALIIGTTYGYHLDRTGNDPVLYLVNRMMDRLSAAFAPGRWLVDFLPSLKHMPDWMPGAGFKRTAKVWKAEVAEAFDLPFEFVKRRMAEDAHRPSYVASAISGSDRGVTEDDIKHSAGTLYAGGSDTTVGVLTFAYLALVKYPAVLAKVHEELDRVVGPDRLPQLADRARLPYLECVLLEALRWQPITPIGGPRVSGEDQEYAGYLIPRGAFLLANVRGFTRDPAVYRDPEAFRPERFAGPDAEPDPRGYAFGYGRRVCPGRLLAEQSMFLTLAQSLAVFDVGRARGEDGGEVDPEVRIPAGTLSRPEPFPFRMAVRSEGHERLIRENAAGLAAGAGGGDARLMETYGLMPRDGSYVGEK